MNWQEWKEVRNLNEADRPAWIYTTDGKVVFGLVSINGFRSEQLLAGEEVSHFMLITGVIKPSPPQIDLANLPDKVSINGFDFEINGCERKHALGSGTQVRISLVRDE